MLLPTALTVLRPHAAAERRPLLGSAALGVVGVVVDLARPWPLAVAIDCVTTGGGVLGLSAGGSLVLAGVAVVVLTAISGWAEMAATVASGNEPSNGSARACASSCFDRAMTLSLRWHDRTRSGELVSRLTTDVSRLLDALVAVCATLVPDAVRLSLVVVALVLLDPALATVALAVLPVLLVLAVRQRRLVGAAQVQARTESGRLAAIAVDLIRNVRAVQAFGQADRTGAAFAARNDRLAVGEHRRGDDGSPMGADRRRRPSGRRGSRARGRWAPGAGRIVGTGPARRRHVLPLGAVLTDPQPEPPVGGAGQVHGQRDAVAAGPGLRRADRPAGRTRGQLPGHRLGAAGSRPVRLPPQRPRPRRLRPRRARG